MPVGVRRQKIKKMLRLTQERIDFINLSTNTVDVMDYISDKQVVEILYSFIKTKIMVIDLSKYVIENDPRWQQLQKSVLDIQNEIKVNKNKKDIRIIMLDQLLQSIFHRLSILNDISELDQINEDLLKALEESQAINTENARLSKIYGGNYSFVKTYQDTVAENDVDRSVVEKALQIVYSSIEDIIDNESIIIQGRKNFIDSIKAKVTKILLKEGIYSLVKPFYDAMLGELYTNIQLLR